MNFSETTKLDFKDQLTAIVRDHMGTSQSERSDSLESEVDAELKAYVSSFRKQVHKKFLKSSANRNFKMARKNSSENDESLEKSLLEATHYNLND